MESEIGPNESVSSGVIRAVTAVTGQKPDSLDPLTEVIDPDALDALFDPPANEVEEAAGSLSFNYCGCRITIDNGVYLTIEPFETTRRQSIRPTDTDQAEPEISHRETHPAATQESSGSRVCFVCQRPIDRENLYREAGELVHPECRAELRCGISLEPSSEHRGESK